MRTLGVFATLLLSFSALSTSLPRAVASNPPESFYFAAGGDHAWTGNTRATLNILNSSGASFYLALGDLSYGDLSEADWCSKFKNGDPTTSTKGFRNIEIIAGNHDTGEARPETPFGAHLDHFVSSCPFTLSGLGGTYGKEYFFDFPSSSPLARFILISPEIGNITGSCTLAPCAGLDSWRYEAGDVHYTWVSERIDEARVAGIPWVIVGMHKNCISAGEKPCSMGTGIFDLLVSKKVDLVLQAHEHHYERSKQVRLNSSSCMGFERWSNKTAKYNSSCIVDQGFDGVYMQGAVSSTSLGGSVVVVQGGFGTVIDPANQTTANASQWGYFAEVMASNTPPPVDNYFVLYRVDKDQINAQVKLNSGVTTDEFTIKRAVLDAYRIDWADHDNSGTVDILDIAPVALYFNRVCSLLPEPDRGRCGYWDLDVSGKVDIGDLAPAAFYYGFTWYSPFPGQADPPISP